MTRWNSLVIFAAFITLRIKIEARNVISNYGVAFWHQEIIVILPVARVWPMKSHLTSDYSLIIEQVGLDTIANKRAKIELVSTAGVLADTFLQNVL